MKRRVKRKSYRGLHFCGFLSIIILFVILSPKKSEYIGFASNAHAFFDNAGDAEYDLAVTLDEELSSKYAYMCYTDTMMPVAEKNPDDVVPIASLTKIMTSIVILDNVESIDEAVVIPHEIYNELYSEGASMAGFLPGEKVTVRDLLYGIMLPSGAEAAVSAAAYVAGSEEAFVELMNDKAESLGLENTHFSNVTGLDSEGHYSTAKEVAQMLAQALKYDDFVEIAKKKSYYVRPTNKHSDGFVMNNTVFKKIGDNNTSDTDIICGKTGFTYDAGLCLATYGEKDGEGYIVVALGAPGNHRTEQKQVYDTVYLYDNYTD